MVQGGRLAVRTGAEEAQSLFDVAKGYAVLAAVNSSDSVTVSGDKAAIQYVQKQAEKQRFSVRRMKVGVTYHSRHIERVADSYLASIQSFCSTEQLSVDEKSTCSNSRHRTGTQMTHISYPRSLDKGNLQIPRTQRIGSRIWSNKFNMSGSIIIGL